MAIITIFDLTDMTPDKYGEVIKQREAAGAGTPDGRVHHVASATETGFQIVDVWESAEKLEQFGEILIPVLVQAGVTPVEPQVTTVHNIIA